MKKKIKILNFQWKAGYLQRQVGNKIINFFKSVLSAIKFLQQNQMSKMKSWGQIYKIICLNDGNLLKW